MNWIKKIYIGETTLLDGLINIKSRIFINETSGQILVGTNNTSQLTKSGLFASKPSGVQVGFAYFCSDRQTTEGASNGIIIYHKGSDVWVDSLGRTVA